MFEELINRLFNKNLEKLDRLGSETTLKEIRESEIHPSLVNYVSAEIEYLIFKDRIKIFKASEFDYSDPKIQRHLNEINKELKNKKPLSSNYLKNLLKFAVSFNIHFLSRPNSTLIKFLFSDQSEKSSEEIKKIIRYTYYHTYLKDAITAYIDKKKLDSMNREDFKKLLEKIDMIAKENDRIKLVEAGIEALDNLFNYPGSGGIPVPLVELYLREKKLHDELDNLTNAQKKGPLGDLTAEKIKELLFKEPEDKFEIPLPASDFAKQPETKETPKPVESKPAEKPVEQKTDTGIKPPEPESKPFEPSEAARKTTFEIEPEEEKEEKKSVEESSKDFLNELMEEKEESPKESVDRDEYHLKEETKTKDEEPEKERTTGAEEPSFKTGDFEIGPIKRDAIDDFMPLEEEIILSDNDESFKMQLTIDESDDDKPEKNEKDKTPNGIGFDIERKDDKIKPKESPDPERGSHPLPKPSVEPGPERKTTSEFAIENKSETRRFEEERKKETENLTAKEKEGDPTVEKPAGVNAKTTIEKEDSDIDLVLDGQTPVFTEDEQSDDKIGKDFTYQTKDEEIEISDEDNLDTPRFQIAKLLEHKHMPRILESVFDYDMEDLTLLLEKVSRCSTFDKAVTVIDKHLSINHINSSSKESLILKEIISKHFQY